MSHHTRSLLVGVLVTSCVVTAALGWSGLRLLTQQRELDERAVRQRVDVAADGFAAAIRDRLAEEGDRLDRWIAEPRGAIDGAWPGSVAYVEHSGVADAVRAVGLPFAPLTAPKPAPLAVFDALEHVEFATRQTAVAAIGYRRLVRQTDQRVRAGALLRLARVLRAQRKFADASEAAAALAGMEAIDVDGSWDGRHLSLEAQVLAPIEAHDEMGSSVAAAAARVDLTPEVMGAALASYVRSILSGNTRFDRFSSGDREALSPVEQRVLQVFRGKGNCTACHVGPNFSDERTHNTGVAWRLGPPTDAGAGGGAFKTPTLREIARTAPYMHDGSLATLREVVDFYDGGGHRNAGLDEEIRPLKLAPEEQAALVAFLQVLSGQLREGQTSLAP